VFSQPAGTEDAPDALGAAALLAPPTLNEGSDALISMAATLALREGNPDGIRAQLPPWHHAAFDMALAVQQMRTDAPESEKDRRISMRTQDEIEKRRAARKAADEIAAEERAALYAAADDDGDTFALLSPMELDQLPEAEILVEGFLVKESLVRVFGPPKSYKSFIMLDLAACIGAGIPWHGKRVEAAKVLYVVAEGVRGIKRRVRAWEALNKRAMTGVHFYERAVQLGDRKEVSTLIRTAKKGGYELIVLDTQARCTVGLEENSASEMGVVVAALDVLKEVTGACVALVHHSGASGGRARGSTAILGALDAEFEVEADKESMSVTVHTRAQKDLAEASSVDFDLVTPGPGHSLAVRPRRQWYSPRPEDLAPLPAAHLAVLRSLETFGAAGASADMVARQMQADKIETRQALGQLQSKGCIRPKGANFLLDRLGRLHLSGTLDSVRED
jgi:hypothetical protein